MLIYFLGYIGAGKSKWGRRVADKLNYNFVDTREMMIQKSGLSFYELLQNREQYIRLEQQALREVSRMQNTVIAVSEMLPCRADNMGVMNGTGITFYLRAGAGCIMMRISKKLHEIPMLKGIDNDFIPDFIKMELSNRTPHYEKAKINELERELNIDKVMSLITPYLNNH